MTTNMAPTSIRPTADEMYAIGMAVSNLVASMQLLGHSNPVHSLAYRHGETDEYTQFAEDFAVVCNRGGGNKEARDRLVAFADSRNMLRFFMERMGEALTP